MENQSTHFISDGEKVVISPDLVPAISFLQEIEKEVESLLGIEKKLGSIRKHYKEMLEFVGVLSKKLKENSIDFRFTFSENPINIADKLNFVRPVRSEMIVLFANLEVLFCLNMAYENKISDEQGIRKLAMNENTIKSFLKKFCLSENNEWGKTNTERLKYITADDMRRLRNSLTHFFSVGKAFGVSYPGLETKARKLEKATKFKARLISPDDLYQIIKGAARLMIEKWSKDCNKCIAQNSNDFKERILCVREIVNRSGAIIIKNSQINI